MSATIGSPASPLIAKAEEIFERIEEQDLVDRIDDALYAVEEVIEWCEDVIDEEAVEGAEFERQKARATAAVERLRTALGVEP